VRNENLLPIGVEVKSSGDVGELAERDPETPEADFVFKPFVLHQENEKTPIDGIFLAKSKANFASKLNGLCQTRIEFECFLDVEIPVVRGNKTDLERAMRNWKMTFQPLQQSLPRVVSLLIETVHLEHVGKVLTGYSKIGVIVPAEAIAAEFRREGKELLNATNWDIRERKTKKGNRDILEGNRNQFADELGATRDSDQIVDEPEDEDRSHEFEGKPSLLNTNEEDTLEDDSDEDDYSPGDDALPEKYPETDRNDINHHFVLHQSADTDPVDGVLSMKNGGAFKTSELDRLCNDLSDDIKCLKGVSVVVIRATKDHLDHALQFVPEAQFSKLEDMLPEFVAYLRKTQRFKDVQGLIDEYAGTGVNFPIQKVEAEFEREHTELTS